MAFLLSHLFLVSLFLSSCTAAVGKKSIYVVYMGRAANPDHDHPGDSHLQLLASVLDKRDRVSEALVRRYKHGFSGFAARLTKEAAAKIATKAGVVSVFEDTLLQLHTTRSWDFLQYQDEIVIDADDATTASSPDAIIGILDTGIWPESESFGDKDMGPIPSRWKGVCMESSDFRASDCNRKLIGARYYNDSSPSRVVVHEGDTPSPRDSLGHGTHTASTAGGRSIAGASYYGLATGTAKGGSTRARIAAYRVCANNGCRASAILAGFDDAIADGVDVLSLSLGAPAFLKPDFATDPIAIGAFHAVDRGITVVCSAGNDGPSPKTVVNAAPWILTVGATTIDRYFESDVILGGDDNDNDKDKKKMVVKGEGINFSNLQKSPIYPLIEGGSAKASSSTSDDAKNCNPNSLDANKIKGKIVLCQNSDDNTYTKLEKMMEVSSGGGVGLILIDDADKAMAYSSGAFPMTLLTSQDGAKIKAYINSTRNPVATILPTTSVNKYKPAPTVVSFSSRGPFIHTANLLKPDIVAPGVNILAAWIGTNDSSQVPIGQKPSQFNLLSGTSMSCPHISGVAANIKSAYPAWGPSAIRSAIMTTATDSNTDRAPITTNSGSPATPHDYGAGEVNPSAALQPGLVYETDTNDYLQFLCNYGYKISTIKLITSVPTGFECPNNSSTDLISNLNYPSIAVSKFNGKESKKVSRTVTNVGSKEDRATYTVSIKSPSGLNVKVVPERLVFTENDKKLEYQVIFSPSSSVTKDMFGSITWSNGKYKVRTPFVVSSEGAETVEG
ncbi:hypothetical protein Syun_015822 [Stephania yunnanensis]|uniref:Subtilisin n=1 Tax=Stephania yunnanensis TaxID=152371 RepID=A0AAP0PA39_9MAGN